MNQVLFLLLCGIVTATGLMPLFIFVFVSVALHEYAHFVSAKKRGVKAKGIMIGFGPSVVSFRKVNGKLKILFPKGRKKPDGGLDDKESFYVDVNLVFLGGGCVFDDDELDAMPAKGRIATYAAGPLVNLVLGFVMILIPMCIWNGILKGVEGTAVSIATMIPRSFSGLVSSITSTDTLSEGAAAISRAASGYSPFYKALFLCYVGGVLNFVLGVFNLIPIPGLDGGQIALAVPELFHKEPDKRMVRRVNFVCVAALLSYTALFYIKDIILWVLK